MDLKDIIANHREGGAFPEFARSAFDHLGHGNAAALQSVIEAQRLLVGNGFLGGTRAASEIDALRESDRLYREAMGASNSVVARAACGELQSPTVRALLGEFDSPTMKMLRGDFDSAAMRVARGEFDDPATRALLGHMSGDTMKVALGYHGTDAMLAIRDVIDRPLGSVYAEAAKHAAAIGLPDALSVFQPLSASLEFRLGLLEPERMAMDRNVLSAFAHNAAMADAFADSSLVDRSLMAAFHSFASSDVPLLGSLAAHRAFLDAAGLALPRWPRFRLLSVAEKRRRMRARLARNAEEPHVKKARSLVHRYELLLRDIIDAEMAETYGENWQWERLAGCGCKTLIGKANSRGGDPIDHADYAQYREIMCDPDHHAAIFSAGFADRDALAELITEAGRLRARSHHAQRGKFSPEDLRSLRLVWRTIETGLLALTSDVDIVDAW